MTTELIITKESINAIANKELKKNLSHMVTALAEGKKADWKYADALHATVVGEQFSDDFDDLKSYSTFLGVTPAEVTQKVNAVQFMIDNNIPNESATVATAYKCSTLKDKYSEFMAWCYSNYDIDEPYKLSIRKLNDLIKEWKATLEAVEVDTAEGETENTDAMNEPEEETEELSERDSAIKTIKLLMEQYNITAEELA